MRTRLALIIALAALLTAPCLADGAKSFDTTGKITAPDGKPAASATVEARTISRYTDWVVAATSKSTDDGSFTLKLAPGGYYFRAHTDALVSPDDYDSIEVKPDGSLSKPIEIHLEKGCRVEGTVVDTSTGKPVGGVSIITRNGDHAQSSESGAWSMVVARRNQAATAIKDGYYWPIVNFSGSGDTARVKVEIKPGGVIKGRVVDEQGKPIVGAHVRTEKSGYFRAFGARADAEGRFTLYGLDPDSRIEVSASADGYDYNRDQSAAFASGSREAEIEITLSPVKVRTIGGRVTRPDGSPVEGATVAYGEGPSWVDYTTAKTDKDGNYKLSKAGIRKNIVAAFGDGLAPVLKQVEADKDVTLDFQVKPGHTIEGRVEDEAGNPLAGVRMSASMDAKVEEARDSMYGSIAGASTDKDGKFKLEDLPEGVVYVDAYAKDFDSISNERLRVDRKDQILVLKKTVPGQISGIVLRAADGKPVTEFNVRIDFSRNGGRSSGLSPGIHEQGMNFQAADGKFVIKGFKLTEGYRVEVNAPGYMQGSLDPVMVKPASEDAYNDAVVRLSPAAPFEGAITDATTGTAVEGVLVTAWDTGRFGTSTSFTWDMSGTSLKSVSIRTDTDGRFRIESMPFASGMIMLEKPGFARTMVKKVSFSRPFEVRLEKGATVTGSVADDQGKVPPGAWLNVERVDLNLSFRGDLGPDGNFKLTDLPPGDYIVLQYKDGRSTRNQSFEVKAGETFNVDWVQRGEVTVEGAVLRAGGPVTGAHIRVNSMGSGMNWVGGCDVSADGSYKLTLRKPGKYLFSCDVGEWRDPDHISSSKTVELGAGANRVDFRLPCGSISGRLLDKTTGTPLANASVRPYIRETDANWRGRETLYSMGAEPSWHPGNEFKTGKNGEFHFKNLKAGTWLICAVLGGERSTAVPAGTFKLTEGEAKTGVIAKVPPTGSAKISIAGAKDLPKGTIAVCVDAFGMVHYPRHENGRYLTQIDGLPAGKTKVLLSEFTGLLAEVPFEVRPERTSNVTVKPAKLPRIVFRPKAGSITPEGRVSVAFRLTTPEGKPVLRDMDGLRWGSILEGTSTKAASVSVKPGKYLLKAAMRTDRDSWGDEADLAGWFGTVTVKPGKDTVIEMAVQE